MKFANVLVVGGAGFIGRHLVAELARRGMRVTVPSRRRERAKRDLILLPTVDVVEADVSQRGVLERLARGQDAVVNLIGILHGDFSQAHVELPLTVVSACRAARVRRVLHVSALGASPDAPSQYLRSKAKGEQALLDCTDLDVTVFRPSVVFGPDDRFLNQFATLARFLPVIAVPCPGARFQPVYVGDVARAMAASLDELASHGRRYELAGPREYSMKELVEAVCAMTGRHRIVVGLPDWLSYLQAHALEQLPGKLMTRDNYFSMKVPSTSSAPFPFGIQPQALEAIAPLYLAHHKPRERYSEMRGAARR